MGTVDTPDTARRTTIGGPPTAAGGLGDRASGWVAGAWAPGMRAQREALESAGLASTPGPRRRRREVAGGHCQVVADGLQEGVSLAGGEGVDEDLVVVDELFTRRKRDLESVDAREGLRGQDGVGVD